MTRPAGLRLAVAAFTLVVGAHARDAFVLLSGGGTPLTNNYSQYLQARALAAHLQARYPADSVWVFFGIGNREGEAPVLADVRRQVKEDGYLRESWLPGALKNNRPARKQEVLTALREEILPAVRDGGTLYLFVGDHGTLARQEPKESVITLWKLKPRPTDNGWVTDQDELLSVSELRATLDAGLGRGRVVFCMTQCHSGGFHYLGLTRTVRPEADWFAGSMPSWVETAGGKILPVAGFTATDEASLAAGCDPDPDPDRWAGYERFIPERLLAVDLFTGEPSGQPLDSYADAHAAAVVIDETIDKPRSTSEQFLADWATLVEKLAAEPALMPSVRASIETYQRSVDCGLAAAKDLGLAAKRAQFERFIEVLEEQNPAAAGTLAHGSREDLEQTIGPTGHRSLAASPPSERARIWREDVRPAWKAAVEANAVPSLDEYALAFEKYLLAQEDKGRELLFGSRRNSMLNDIYWQSGYALPGKYKPGRAEAYSLWGAQRHAKIFEWARESSDPVVRNAAEKLAPRRALGRAGPRVLSTKTAAERTLFYRRVLAAWAFLIEVKHTQALAQLRQLMELESVSMPSGRLNGP